MCFSAQVDQKIRDLRRSFQAEFDYEAAEHLFHERLSNSAIKITRGFEANFDEPQTPAEKRIKELIDQYRLQQASKLEKDLFTQKKRLVEAERKIKECDAAGKAPPKKTQEDQRIATTKVELFTSKLSALRSSELTLDDKRIFPMVYAPIILKRDGTNAIELARYHCRQTGKPAFYDAKFPGLYNARRNNIDKFWRSEFGSTHALLVVDTFFENVDRDGKNVVLHFKPNPPKPMLVACLYSRWVDPKGGQLLSFAAVTDEPPAEVAAAGHDRMIVNLKPEHVETWLSPQGRSDAELQSILSDREAPYYAHEVMAA